jgi:tetratricopeptide (TPR) repeat protein
MSMYRWFTATCAFLLVAGCVLAQVEQLPQSEKTPPKSQEPPRSDQSQPDRATGMSSSKNTQVDISPPPDDAKNHPFSDATAPDDENDSADVQEMRPWDPHRAAKDNEVGLFYFKRKNYRAALARFQEALEYKPNDAEVNFRIAECYEKLDDPDKAAKHYKEYLKILPDGPLALDANKALEKLGKTQAAQQPERTQQK